MPGPRKLTVGEHHPDCERDAAARGTVPSAICDSYACWWAIEEPPGPKEPFDCAHGVRVDHYFATCLGCSRQPGRSQPRFGSNREAERFVRRRYVDRILYP